MKILYTPCKNNTSSLHNIDSCFQQAHPAAVERGRRGHTFPPSSGSDLQEPTLRSQRGCFQIKRRLERQVPRDPRTDQATLGEVADLRWPSPRVSRVGLGGSR